jgi:peroxiredoxin
MQQVVDLQKDKTFTELHVPVLSVSPDPASAWRKEGTDLGITTPMLSDPGNQVWLRYGTLDWMMGMNEPGHTFFLVGPDGNVAWVRDYGSPEHGGVMYVPPRAIASQVKGALTGS